MGGSTHISGSHHSSGTTGDPKGLGNHGLCHHFRQREGGGRLSPLNQMLASMETLGSWSLKQSLPVSAASAATLCEVQPVSHMSRYRSILCAKQQCHNMFSNRILLLTYLIGGLHSKSWKEPFNSIQQQLIYYMKQNVGTNATDDGVKQKPEKDSTVVALNCLPKEVFITK